MIIEILRKKKYGEPYLQTFEYQPLSKEENVVILLEELNKKLDDKIAYKKSCLQKKCGACAMLINGKPALACHTPLKDLGEKVHLEPLKKFPVVEDLVVDRSILQDNLKKMKVFFEDKALISEKRNVLSYEAMRCLQCGLCLEVCPGFHAEDGFTGMAGAMTLAGLLNRLSKEEIGEAARMYRRYVYEGCGISLACKDICPAKINIEDLLINSNAIAVYKRYLKEDKKHV